MSFDVHTFGSLVPESYSRELDERVSYTELPYGYDTDPPPADTGDFNQRILESNKQYPLRRGRAI